MSSRLFMIRPPRFLIEAIEDDALVYVNDPLYEIKHPERRWLLLIPGLLKEVIETKARISFELRQPDTFHMPPKDQPISSRGSTYNFIS